MFFSKCPFRYQYFSNRPYHYRYFQKFLININVLVNIFKIRFSITISIFSRMALSNRYWYINKLPYQYWYRYRYFSKVSIYWQSIFHIDISNRAIGGTIGKGLLVSWCHYDGLAALGVNRKKFLNASSAAFFLPPKAIWIMMMVNCDVDYKGRHPNEKKV